MCTACEKPPPLLLRHRRIVSHTAYANCSGDHLVGWANSSLRWPQQLQDLQLPPEQRRRGVVRQDALQAAFDPRESRTRAGSPLRARGMSTAPSAEVDAAERQVEDSRYVPDMLRALSTLPWRRVDVCFKEANVPLLAHNHIQVRQCACGLS